MSDGNLNISWTADEQDLAKAQSKLIKQQEEMIDKYKKLVTESKKGGKERQKAEEDARKEFERFAAATMKINRTPLERYKEEMFKLNTALKAGKIDQETFNRATAQAKLQLDQAGQAGKQAFGTEARAALTQYITGMVTLSGSVGTIAKLWGDVNAQAEMYATRQREGFFGVGGLAQTADTVEEMRTAYEASRQTFGQGAGASVGEASKLQFAITSALFEKYRKDIAELQASGVVEQPITMINAAAALESSMGTAATGGFRRIVSAAFGAGKIGTTTAEAVTEATAMAGPQAKALGFTVPDLFAAVSTLSKVTGEASEAGTLMEAFAKQVEKEGMKQGLQPGRSLMQYVGDIQTMEAGGRNVRDILGDRQEALTGYRILRDNVDLFNANLQNVMSDMESDAFGRKTSLYKSIPELVGTRAQKEAVAQEELARTREGVFANLAAAVRADIRADYTRRQDDYLWKTPLRGAAMNLAFGAEQYINGPEAFVMERGNLASQRTQEMIQMAVEALRDAAESNRATAQEMQRASSTLGRQRAAAAVTPE